MVLLRVSDPFPFCGVFSQNGFPRFIFKLCFSTKGKVANTLHTVICTQIINPVFQRKWPAFFLVLKSITVWGLSNPFFYYVYHQTFSQAYAGAFILLDCICGKGGSSNIYSFSEASSSLLSSTPQVSCSFSTVHMPASIQPLCLLFRHWSWDYLYRAAVWISRFPLWSASLLKLFWVCLQDGTWEMHTTSQ